MNKTINKKESEQLANALHKLNKIAKHSDRSDKEKIYKIKNHLIEQYGKPTNKFLIHQYQNYDYIKGYHINTYGYEYNIGGFGSFHQYFCYFEDFADFFNDKIVKKEKVKTFKKTTIYKKYLKFKNDYCDWDNLNRFLRRVKIS